MYSDLFIKFEFIKSLEGAIPTKQDRALLRVIAHDDNYKGNKYLRAEKFGDILRRLRGEPRRKRTKTKGQIKTYQNNTEKFINAVVSGKVTPLDAVRKIFDADPSGRMRVTELSARNNDFLRKIATVLPEINTQVLTFNLTGKQIHKRISALRKIINTRLDAMDDKYERTETPIIGKNNNSKYTPVNSQARKDLSSGNSSKFMESINHVLKNVHL